MNEKFEELLEKSKFDRGIDLEKFAILIVTECADLVDENEDSGSFATFGMMIKNHFGMEL